MSLNKSATRRLSLLAGSSIVAASLAAFTGVALTPTFAAAQVTCASPAAGPAPVVAIAAGTYDPGITCTYVGTSASVLTTGAVTVSTAAGGNGVNLTAAGADAINWNSTAGALTGGAQTNGALIDASSATGAININTAALTATTAGATYGIRAVASGAGAVTITRTTTGVVSNNVLGGEAAIWAQSGGGAVSVTTLGATNGRLRGITAQTSGTGTISLNIGGNVSAAAADGIAAIETVAGTGGTTITINSGSITGGAGPAIRATSASTSAATAVNVQNLGGTVASRVDFSGVTAGGVTFNNTGATATTGRWTAGGASVFTGRNDTLTMSGSGANTMAAGSSINFGAGNDTWTLNALLAATTATVDFGAGADTFNMSGRLAVDGLLTLTNLEAFNHSGVIYLGGTTGTASDGAPDDILRMTSGTFTGSGAARIVLDVKLDADSAQAGCATASVADCLDLRGAATAGVTALTLNYLGIDQTQGSFNPTGVTLVDVGGGTSAAGHFVIDPAVENYRVDRVFGGIVARPGLVGYGIVYDAANQRHVLVGLPRSEVLEYAILPGVAQSIWHMTTRTVSGRQADLRDRSEAGPVWLRATGEYTQRDAETEFPLFGGATVADNAYKLYAGTIMGGMDLISGGNEAYDYAAGVQIGYVASTFDLNESATSGRFSGATGGAYASLWSDWFFADAAVNLNGLALDHDAPGLGSETTTFVNSVGVQGEAGVRTRLLENTFAEPLVNLSWVRTSFEEISQSGGKVKPSDSESMRGALGMRLGSTLPGESVSATWFVAGRAWYEFDGEHQVAINNPGADMVFGDEFSGAFGEAELGINVFNSANTLTGFATTGVKWKDGYSAIDLALGVRMAW